MNDGYKRIRKKYFAIKAVILVKADLIFDEKVISLMFFYDRKITL